MDSHSGTTLIVTPVACTFTGFIDFPLVLTPLSVSRRCVVRFLVRACVHQLRLLSLVFGSSCVFLSSSCPSSPLSSPSSDPSFPSPLRFLVYVGCIGSLVQFLIPLISRHRCFLVSDAGIMCISFFGAPSWAFPNCAGSESKVRAIKRRRALLDLVPT